MAWFSSDIEKTKVETVEQITYKKCGNIVECDINNLVVTNGETGFTVPDEYKPSTDVYAVGSSLSVGLVIVRIYGGKIQFLNTTLNTYTSGTMFCSFCYLLN